MHDLETLNRTMFWWSNGGEGTPGWLIRTATGIADYLIYLVPVVLLGLWL